MNGPPSTPEEGRVLILAPTPRDARTTADILGRAGVPCVICDDLSAVCDEIDRGAGAALLTQEAILADRDGRLPRALARQEPWSDFPLVVLAPAGADSPSASRRLESIGHMTLVKRPVSIAVLVSTVRAALRDRVRQYAAREDVRERDRRSRELREKEEGLRFALQTARLGSWELDLDGEGLTCNDACMANFGRAPGSTFTYTDLLAAIHPDDLEATRAALDRSVAGLEDFEAEYRVVRPDGSLRWILARGQPFRGEGGRPGRIVGLTLDITARKQSEDALREADRRKDEFLAMLAHELRNPLAAIDGAAHVFRTEGAGLDDLEWGRGVLDRQVRQLRRLVDDLLDVSRINRGKVRLRPEAIDAAPVIAAAVGAVRSIVDQRGHRLDVEVAPGPIRLEADPARLEQILVNLLNNAAKYTESGGRISLRVAIEGDDVAFRVADDGLGIPPEQIPRMFELFAQGDRSLARSEGGLGIGLTLVKGLAEMHGGSVSASSPGEGLGSEFVVRLPSAPAPATPRPEPNPARADGRDRAEPGSSRILVVDDNADAARGLSRLLRMIGHDVRVAHDGAAALDLARAHRPEVVLLDIGLPGMDGYEVATRLRLETSCRDALLIAITGYGQEKDRRRSAAAGIDHHLVKPVDYDALISLMSRRPGLP